MAMQKKAQYAVNYYEQNYGLPKHQAAGLVGNFIQESSMNTGARNPGDGRDGSDSIGIMQANGQRARNLAAFARGTGRDIGDLNAQLDFAAHEMGFGKQEYRNLPGFGAERVAGDKLLNAQNIRESAAAGISYERPAGWKANNPTAGHGWGNRYSHANALAGAQYAGGSDEALADAAASGAEGPAISRKRPSVRDSFNAGNLSTPTAPRLQDGAQPGILDWIGNNVKIGLDGGDYKGALTPSPEKSTATNMLLGAPAAISDSSGQTIGGFGARMGAAGNQMLRDFFVTPESQLPAVSQADVRNAQSGGAADTLTTNLQKLVSGGGGLAAAAPSSFSIPVGPPTQPNPFVAQPYQASPAPSMEPLPDQPLLQAPDYGPLRDARTEIGPQTFGAFDAPMPPELQAPDYTKALDLFEQARPQSIFTPEMERKDAINTLASALSAGANTSGWGGWGAAVGGLSQGLATANQNSFQRQLELKSRDEQSRRQYAMDGSRLQGGIAERNASIGNQNAGARYEVETGNARNRFQSGEANREAARSFALGDVDLQRAQADATRETNTANANIGRDNAARQVDFRNNEKLNRFKVDETNQQTAFQVGQENALRVYNSDVARQELKAPKVTQNKDSLVIQRVGADGNYTFDVVPFGKHGGGIMGMNDDTLTTMKKMSDVYGDQSPMLGVQKYSMLLGGGNIQAVKYQMAEDAQKGGYIDAILPGGLATLQTEADQVLQSKNIYPGTKEYADQQATIINQLLSTRLDLSDPQVLARAAQAGNVGASLLLQAAGAGGRAGAEQPLVPGQGK